MRALELAGQEAPPFATLTPAARGTWQWVGTTGLIFVPEGRLPRATSYRVEVPAGTKAQDGSALASAYRFELTTERPALLRVDPSAPPKRLDSRATFAIHFNQPVADAEASRAVSIVAAGKRVEFDIRRPDPKDEARIDIAPRAPLPLDSDIDIRADASLRGTEGPLVSGQPSSFEFRTYGPLKVVRSGCGYGDDPCSPGQGNITIELTNSVKVADVLKMFQIDPPIPLRADIYDDDDGTSQIWLRAKLAPSTKYRVRIPAGLRDRYGQALASDYERTLAVGPYRSI
jgi:hypothetical protein